jgi:hypothetical protein
MPVMPAFAPLPTDPGRRLTAIVLALIGPGEMSRAERRDVAPEVLELWRELRSRPALGRAAGSLDGPPRAPGVDEWLQSLRAPGAQAVRDDEE